MRVPVLIGVLLLHHLLLLGLALLGELDEDLLQAVHHIHRAFTIKQSASHVMAAR